jgi:hypothetical protein
MYLTFHMISKVKLPLCVAEYHGIDGRGNNFTHFNIGTKCEWLALLFSRFTNWDSLGRRLGGSQSKPGRGDEKKAL